MWMENVKLNDDEVYTGEVGYGNRPEGKGKAFNIKTGKLIYEGWFRNGQPYGYGTLYKDSGQVFTGDFRNGTVHGHARVTDVNGKLIFEGEFTDGKQNGPGLLISGNGTRVEGTWKNGLKTGHCRQIEPDGTILEGEYVEGRIKGKATIFRPTGIIEEVEYDDEGYFTVINSYQKMTASSSEEQSPKPSVGHLDKPEEETPPASETDPDKYLIPSGNNASEGVSQDVLQYFKGIIGMNNVKKQLDSIYKRFKIDAMRVEKFGYQTNSRGFYFIITGNPGTGKTTVARIIGSMLHNTGILPSDTFVEADRSTLVSENIGGTALKTMKAIDQARGGTLFIDEAYALYRKETSMDFGPEAVETLLKDMEDHRGQYCVVMAGYKEPMMDMLRNVNPGLASRFDYRIEIPNYSEEELLDILLTMASSQHFLIEKGSRNVILHQIKKEKVDDTFDNARFARRLLDKAIENQAERLSSLDEITEDDLQILIPEDFGTIDNDEDSLDSSLKKLDRLIGLESVKRAVRSMADYMAVQIESEKRGLATASSDISMNLVFTGNPGTGKTTVARLIGEIYYHLGLLKRKEVFVEVGRPDLVGEYQGQTAQKVKEVVHNALGGVLFIDEAYSLVNGSGDTFGLEAVNTLVAEIENNRKNLAVILAGYTNEIEDFLMKNPGLKSRFSAYLEFPDYDLASLKEIFRYEMNRRGFLLNVSDERLEWVLSYRSSLEGFGNARGVRNLCDDTVRQHNQRLKANDLRGLSDEELLTVTDEDIPNE